MRRLALGHLGDPRRRIEFGCVRGLADGAPRWHGECMNKPLNIREIRELSVTDRLRLIEAVWDTLTETPDDLVVPDWHRGVLDDRLAAHAGDPEAAWPWAEVKSEIVDALRK